MFTHKDIEFRTIFVINSLNHDRKIRVQSGELLLEETNDDKTKKLTKIPFQKILALFVIGHITITTPLIEKCKQFNVALVVMKPNLRPIFFWSCAAEANYLLRQKQYQLEKNDISIAKVLVANKIQNQLALLNKTRKHDLSTENARKCAQEILKLVPQIDDYYQLMGMEGRVSKQFFAAYFQEHGWTSRMPRAKTDPLNVTLDIGYTILFNFIEAFAHLFGFDVFVGVYHRLWFKRKSLICDLVEPFRCIIDHTIRNGLNRKQIQPGDFECVRGEYRLKREKTGDYYKLFFDALIPHKMEIFKYVQKYYRCFMRQNAPDFYPRFNI